MGRDECGFPIAIMGIGTPNHRKNRPFWKRMLGSSEARIPEFKTQARPIVVVIYPLPQGEKGKVDLNVIGNSNGESGPTAFFRFYLNASIEETNRFGNNKQTDPRSR